MGLYDSHSRTEAVLALKTFVLDNDLPRTDMTLFNTCCPYCGKSDRIRPLPVPDDSAGAALSADLQDRYARLWQQAVGSKKRMGVCKFCHNLLHLGSGTAATPFED
jgi:hypothetical protein